MKIILAENARIFDEEFLSKFANLDILTNIPKNKFSLMLVHEGPPLKGVDLQLNNQLNTMFCSHPLKLFKYDDFYHFGTFWQTIIITSSLNHYSAK